MDDYFAMVLNERPRSLEAQKPKGYIERLKMSASSRVENRPMFSDTPLSLRAIWFHRKKAEQDVDNILKWIADALKGIVYNDDRLLHECAARRIDLRAEYEIRSRSGMPKATFDELLDSIRVLSNEDVLFIEVMRLGSAAIDIGPEV